MRDVKTSNTNGSNHYISQDPSVIVLKTGAKSKSSLLDQMPRMERIGSIIKQIPLFKIASDSLKNVVKHLLRRQIISDQAANIISEALTKLSKDSSINNIFDSKEYKEIVSKDNTVLDLLRRKLKEEVGESNVEMLNRLFSPIEHQNVVLRMWANSALSKVKQAILSFMSIATTQADNHSKTIIPGQREFAVDQSTSLGHKFLDYVIRAAEQVERIEQIMPRINKSPAGAFYGAGSSLTINPKALARNLGMASPIENASAALNDTSFLIEFACILHITSTQVNELLSTFLNWLCPDIPYRTLVL